MKYFLFPFFVFFCFAISFAQSAPKQNLLVITVDDMSADSLGCFNCKLPNTSPHIDKLASESLAFRHAHVQVGNCYPSRNVMFSGLYPHNSQVEGFYKIQNDYPTLTDLLKKAGYYTGIRGKVTHTTPYNPYPAWDRDLTNGPDGKKYALKDVASYGVSTARGIAEAKEAGKPFYLNINISDPHKPFWHPNDKHPTSREFTVDEVPVPGFLFDHPEIRKELVLYYNSVRRADDAVGSILEALAESGQADNTILVFLSDHGMPLPFAKTALWHHSTHTPLLVKVPGLTKAGSEDHEHMVSAVDFVPTFLDLLELPPPEKLDGSSFAPAIRGEKQPERTAVFKVYNENAGGGRHPMRGVQTRDYLYLWNPWADGENKFKTATTGTASYRTMQKVAQSNPQVAARLELFDHRVLEELYHVKHDPDCLKNLVDKPRHQEALARLRRKMEAFMRESNDHALEAFQQRKDPKAGPAYTARKQAEADARRANKRKQKKPKADGKKNSKSNALKIEAEKK